MQTAKYRNPGIDYISDHLGISNEEVIQIITLLREEKILADSRDLTAYILRKEQCNRSLEIIRFYNKLENFLLTVFEEEQKIVNLKELREEAGKCNSKKCKPGQAKSTYKLLGGEKLDKTFLSGRQQKSYFRLSSSANRHSIRKKM